MLAEARGLLARLQRYQIWPKLFILVGPSGVGKTSLCRMAIKTLGNLSYVISATTRARRPGEINGRDYYFLNEAEFLARKARGEFLETTKIYHSYYGILRDEIQRKLQRGKSLIMDLDIRGLVHLKRAYGRQAVGIFILPPSITELQRRYAHRTSAQDEDPQVRLGALQKELRWLERELSRAEPRVDYLLVNKVFKISVQSLIEIIKIEQQRIIGGNRL